MAHYLDTSALVKLVVVEPETRALERWIKRTGGRMLSSDLARTELFRAVRRGAPERMERAREVLDSVDLLRLTTATYESAGRLDPVELRSLDALHLAAALELGDDLDGFTVYDHRLRSAASTLGIPTLAPGQTA